MIAESRLDCRASFDASESITDNMTRPARAPILALLLLAACAAPSPPLPPTPPGVDPTPFSGAAIAGSIPAGWVPYRLMRFTRPTEYRLVESEGTVAVKAVARAAASGLQHGVSVDLHDYPWLEWRWKVPKLIDGADSSFGYVEDSPARIIVTFEGGRERLPAFEQINFDLALAITGHELPYATLMYVWANAMREGEIITHPRSDRVKMIVAGNDRKDLGVWHEELHNVLEDYRRAFGEDPPRVKSVGIMSDSDTTGSYAEAYFGDIHFLRSP